MQVMLKRPDTGEAKFVKVGFSWVLFLLSWIYGVPLFFRGLYLHGGLVFFVCVIVLVAPTGIQPMLGIIIIGLTIFYGVKGNELTGKRLLSKGWEFKEGDVSADFARVSWGVPS